MIFVVVFIKYINCQPLYLLLPCLELDQKFLLGCMYLSRKKK